MAPSDPDNDLAGFASAVGALTHRFNNALTTVMGLSDWHLVAETHAAPLRSDFEKIRAAATVAQQTAQEIQQLACEASRRATRAGAGQSLDAEDAYAVIEGRKAPAPQPVLLVDDQVDVRNSLSVMVRTLGYAVHAVEGGEAALEWLADNRASAVLTDFGMRGHEWRSPGESRRRAASRRSDRSSLRLVGTGNDTGTARRLSGAAQAAPHGAAPRLSGDHRRSHRGVVVGLAFSPSAHSRSRHG